MVFSSLGSWERFGVSALLVVAFGALLFWLGAIYVHMTQVVPDTGGAYTEGIVGQPLYLNPLLSQASGADSDIVRLVYSGLFTHDSNGQIQKDLVSDYSVSDDNKVYTMFLRTGVRFHDGQELTADDVVYTFRIIQDPAYKSPLKSNWQGVDVSQTDRYTVVFTLKKPYFGFLENLTTGILPKHVWENIGSDKFSLNDSNLSPVGSGPYMVSSPTGALKKDSSGNVLSYELKSFPGYSGRAAYISKIIFRFYPSEETLIDAYNRREVLGMAGISPNGWERIKDQKSALLYELRQPRLFAVFLNEIKSVPLGYPEVRRALAMGIDRDALVRDILAGHGEALSTPLLAGMIGFDTDAQIGYDPSKAAQVLDDAGWKLSGDVRKKGDKELSFELVTPDWPDLIKTADMLRDQWAAIGVRVSVKSVGVADLQQSVIRPREYQALLFGEVSSFNPDPYSFWHSSQKNDPGTNFSLFDDQATDDALAVARETLDDNTRAEQYRIFQERVKDQAPAVFLYSPHYLYVVNQEVKGIDLGSVNFPSDRLARVTDWYMDTKRIRK